MIEIDPAVPKIMLMVEGALYDPSRTSMEEHSQYDYQAGVHELRICLSGLTADEIDTIAHHRAEFALVTDGPVLLVLFRFDGALGWSDVPYTVWRVPPEQRSIPGASGSETRAILHVHLVEAETGILRSGRLIHLPSSFSSTLHAALRAQAYEPFNENVYEQHLAMLRQRYPQSESLLSIAVAHCLIEEDVASDDDSLVKLQPGEDLGE